MHLRIHKLGPFSLDADAGLLFYGKQVVALGPRAVALLQVLVERPGEPVSKEALMQAGWRGLAVEESNLAVQISALRKGLAATPGGEDWIETLPRRGYRYIGPLTSHGEAGGAAEPADAQDATTPGKILVVDDHVLIRDALRRVLDHLAPHAKLLEAPDGGTLMRLVGEHPDLALVLLDLNLPDCDGLAALSELRQRYPNIAIVVLSARHDRADVMQALQGGAVGFIPKSASREVMMQALRLVFAGGIYIPPQILETAAPAKAPNTEEGG